MRGSGRGGELERRGKLGGVRESWSGGGDVRRLFGGQDCRTFELFQPRPRGWCGSLATK